MYLKNAKIGDKIIHRETKKYGYIAEIGVDYVMIRFHYEQPDVRFEKKDLRQLKIVRYTF
jgi:hypothetical protein